MSLVTYFFVMISIGAMFSLIGDATGVIEYSTLFQQLSSCSGQGICLLGNDMGEAIMTAVIGILTNPIFLIPAIAGAFTGLLAGTNFGVIYVIPVLLLVLLVEVFFLPAGFFINILSNTSLPYQLGAFLIMIFNTWLLMSIFTNIRGGE